jgi:hypothetical protein
LLLAQISTEITTEQGGSNDFGLGIYAMPCNWFYTDAATLTYSKMVYKKSQYPHDERTEKKGRWL